MRSLVVATAITISCLLGAAQDIPKQHPFSRYQAMSDHSPFATKEPQSSNNVEVKGFATLPDGDYVILGPSEELDYDWFLQPEGWDDWQITGWRLFLRNNEPQNGFTLRRIEWDFEGCATIFLDKDGQPLVVAP